MSTRSVVAAGFEEGIKGVYVHSDGYPDGQYGMLNVLSTLVARDGVEKVITKIMGKPSGWSSLNPMQQKDELGPGHTDGRFLAVPGYGVQYSRRKFTSGFMKGRMQACEEYRVPGDGGEEYFYVIKRDGTIQWCEGDWPTSSVVNTFDPAVDEVPVS